MQGRNKKKKIRVVKVGSTTKRIEMPILVVRKLINLKEALVNFAKKGVHPKQVRKKKEGLSLERREYDENWTNPISLFT